ncbi:MAG TPA: hypothetical protein VLR89_05430, partial [Anaerolineaceae bacterium]|nr:hypothetical protein [Anaerolineaceae bacterium]
CHAEHLLRLQSILAVRPEKEVVILSRFCGGPARTDLQQEDAEHNEARQWFRCLQIFHPVCNERGQLKRTLATDPQK